ncbi:MAG: ATP-binding protein, partial [Ignavibacteriae bacterium]|nr:ATP-binding protein [Ignavibacteriota bacterium]
LSVLLLAGQWYWRTSVEDHWEEYERSREKQIWQIIASKFHQRIYGLLDIAQSVRSDSVLFEELALQSGESILRAFEHLEEYRSTEEVSIDIIDPVGTVILWAGKSAEKNARILQPEHDDTLITLARAGLHTYLSVSLVVPGKFLSIRVSEPLEVNYPISNRFVISSSFASEISTMIGIDVEIEPGGVPQRSDSVTYIVHLRTLSGETIGYARLVRPSHETEIQTVSVHFDKLVVFFVGCGALCMTMLLTLFATRFEGDWSRGLALIVLLLGLRYAWLAVGFPRTVIGGSFFTPEHYASPFGNGLTGSLGETMISVIIFLLCVVVLFLTVAGWREKIAAKSLPPLFWFILPAAGLGVFFLWMTHGFGEAVRSFVFDSTLEFQDATTLFPSALVAAMYVVILLLTAAYLFVTVSLQMMMLTGLRKAFRARLSQFTELSILAVWIVFLWMLAQLLGLTPKYPQYFPIISFFVAGVFTWWHEKFAARTSFFSLLFSRRLAWVAVACLMLSIPVLDDKLHQKDKDYLQIYADELARPLDSWLSFVVNDGLRTALGNQHLLQGLKNIEAGESGQNGDIAFTLWSQTLLSREGYNSAVVLYDSSGNEMSRFSVGLTTYEQGELLKAMFDAEEEVLQVMDRRVQGGAVKYYGTWSTLRDENMRIAGFVAVMLSASQQALFRGEAPDLLRAATRERMEDDFRELTVSEYRGGELFSTNNPRLYRGKLLPADVEQEFQQPRRRFLWRSETVDGHEFEVLYASDEHQPGIVRALALEVPDIRWHVFNVVKVMVVYAGVFLVLSLLRFVISWKRHKVRGVGFRGRLVLAFSVLAVLSFVLIGYYNRELATEQLESNINRRLEEDLNLLERRMVQTFLDEDDFLNGMTDDFCETVASEYGVDFTIFRSSSLKASSRPELYHASILDARLTGRAYANTVLLGKNHFRDFEQIGEVRYAVGYKPLLLNDRIVGVIAVPALYRQREIDEELAQRNSYTIGVYFLILVIVIVIGLVLANMLSRPLRLLSEASRKVGRGNLDIHLEPQTSDEVGELMSSFTEMVKELKQSREQISRAERELAWKEMAKQVAHEIKNPLTPMKLSIQHLRTAFRDKSPDIEKLVERVTQTVVEQIDALSRIASEFSNFARMPERKFERVDLHHLLTETVDLFHEIRGVEFRTKFSDIHPTLVADGDELRRVFINLVRNSVQAMEAGGVISIETTVADRRCVVRVSDTGPGIPKDIQKKVFEPNFSTKTDGTGLGLAIGKRIIEDLNGTIELESEPGKGSTFTITIPFQGV